MLIWLELRNNFEIFNTLYIYETFGVKWIPTKKMNTVTLTKSCA